MSTIQDSPRRKSRPILRFSVHQIFQRWVLHPFFFILYPVLTLFASNIGQVFVREIVRSVWVSLLITALLLTVSCVILRNWHKAGLLATVIIILSFSYKHVHLFLLDHLPISGGILILADFGLWLWLFLTAPVVIFLSKKPFQRSTHVLNIISGFLLLINTLFLGYEAFQYNSKSNSFQLMKSEEDFGVDPGQFTGAKRDIYYIILDSYAREDVINEIYDLDTREFTEDLESRGFYVADQSYSNYMQTLLSMGSALNMEYLDDLVKVDPRTNSREPAVVLVQENNVIKFLRSIGYRTVIVDSGFALIGIRNADLVITRKNQINAFENELMPVFWSKFFNLQAINQAMFREDQILQFDNLAQVVDEPGPKFVFSHFLIPHPPYVIDRDGNAIPVDSLSFHDGIYYNGSRESYLYGYREQVLFAQKKMKEVVAKIQSSYAPGAEPIIIIQADHGSGRYLDWNSMENTCLRERFSILNAYYLPEDGTELLYPEISPVNSFRLILNKYFGADLELYDDRHYFSYAHSPFDFTLIPNDSLTAACGADQ